MPVAEHLYIHIPFCAKLCPYCSFSVETRFRFKTKAFVDALLAEIQLRAVEFTVIPRTIHLGGGTPSALSLTELEYLLEGLHRTLALGSLVEWTIEVNPATVSPRKAKMLHAFGMNRVSIGAQSWDSQVLQTLGRNHSALQTRATFATLRQAGFENINLDLMFGVPGQSPESWECTLRESLALGPEHLSTYCLTYEEDTEYFDRLQRGEFRENSEQDAGFFECGVELLSAAGYGQYEISNYAKPGRACRHNMAYWAGADYLGLGPSAWSTVGEKRWQNVPDTAAYVRALQAGVRPIATEEILPPETRQAEKIAFGLRMNAGIDSTALARSHDLVTAVREEGLLEDHGPRVRLTARGRLLADEIAAELI